MITLKRIMLYLLYNVKLRNQESNQMGDKKTTAEMLQELLLANPSITASAAAELLGVTRQRVDQIAKQDGLVLADGRRRAALRPRYASYPQPFNAVPKSHKGGANELAVASFLLARGVPVYRSLTVTSRCDLIVDVRDRWVGVEVKSAYRTARGHLTYGFIDTSRFDVLALVDPSGGIHFRPNSDVDWPFGSAPENKF